MSVSNRSPAWSVVYKTMPDSRSRFRSAAAESVWIFFRSRSYASSGTRTMSSGQDYQCQSCANLRPQNPLSNWIWSSDDRHQGCSESLVEVVVDRLACQHYEACFLSSNKGGISQHSRHTSKETRDPHQNQEDIVGLALQDIRWMQRYLRANQQMLLCEKNRLTSNISKSDLHGTRNTTFVMATHVIR